MPQYVKLNSRETGGKHGKSRLPVRALTVVNLLTEFVRKRET